MHSHGTETKKDLDLASYSKQASWPYHWNLGTGNNEIKGVVVTGHYFSLDDFV